MTRRHRKRRAQIYTRSTPGAPPGMLDLPEGGDVTLDAVRYDADEVEIWHLGSPDEIADLRRPGKTVWLDVCGFERRTVEALAAAFGLHPLAVEDAVHTHQRCKTERYDNHDLIVARMASIVDGELQSEQISLFVGPGFVISVQERSDDPFEPARERIRQGRGAVRSAGADYLAYALLDAIVDHYFPLLEEIGDRIEDLEEEIVSAPGDHNIGKIQSMRRTLIGLRRATWPLRDAVGVLARGENPFFLDETRVFLGDTLDHLLRIVDLVESYRDMAGGLMDLHLSMVSTQMNEVMQVLTVISTIFIPLTFIVGLYGMNFVDMPELHWSFGYPVVLGLMAVIGAALCWFFWRRGWIGRSRRRRGGRG